MSLQAVSFGSLLVGMRRGESFTTQIGSGGQFFAATGMTGPTGFDLTSLQANGGVRAQWELDGTSYSFTARLWTASMPISIEQTDGADPSVEVFALWQLEYKAVLTIGSDSTTLTGRAAVWGLAPPYSISCCNIPVRFTSVLFAEASGQFDRPVVFFAWFQEPTAWFGQEVPAASLIRHNVIQA